MKWKLMKTTVNFLFFFELGKLNDFETEEKCKLLTCVRIKI
jgi:hypothetical protein